MTTIALADDHKVMRNGLAGLLKGMGYTILFEAGNGQEFKEAIEKGPLPQVAILDINMPVMDGYETAAWLKEHHPEVQVLALSMYDNDGAIIRMLKCGAKGYILKDSDIADVRTAIEDVLKKGYHYTEMVSGKLIHSLHNGSDNNAGTAAALLQLSKRELEFLKLTCTELSYKEMAEQLFVSPRTVEGYRDALFEKLGVHSRVGLAMYAVRNRIVQV